MSFTVPTSVYNLLLPMYNSPQRHYHDLNHIQFCLSKLSEYETYNINLTNDDIGELLYTIWFHDAIYSPYPWANSSNEKESAELFMQWLKDVDEENNFPDNIANNVHENILATEHHLVYDPEMIGSSNKAIMLDIDLVGFAKPYNEVLKDSDRIFKEYECLGIDKKIMMSNRIKFLKALLQRKRIFYTYYFHNTYEVLARNNIHAVIAESEFQLENME
jgi:predicted metal-dependent HD superfamily phosphohydrolase